jgi:serine/threonine protein kinase
MNGIRETITAFWTTDKRKLGNQKERVLAECDILHSCDHVNIVKLHDIYENENKLCVRPPKYRSNL